MAFKLPKNLVSGNNMQNVLYLVTLALAVSYIMNRQNLALVSLLVVAGAVYMFKKNVVLALGVSIVVTNLLLSMNYFRQFEGFKEGNTGGASAAIKAGDLSSGINQSGGSGNGVALVPSTAQQSDLSGNTSYPNAHSGTGTEGDIIYDVSKNKFLTRSPFLANRLLVGLSSIRRSILKSPAIIICSARCSFFNHSTHIHILPINLSVNMLAFLPFLIERTVKSP